MNVEAVRGVGESNSTLTNEKQKRWDRRYQRRPMVSQNDTYGGKSIRSTKAEKPKGAVSMVQGKESSFSERPRTCNRGD